MDVVLVHVLIVIFLATLIRSAFGFGEALVAVPLLAFRLPVQVAAPLAVLVSVTVAAVIVAQDWHKIHFKSAGWLVVSAMFGIPLGLICLKWVNDTAIKVILGVIIIVFSAYSLLWRDRLHLKHDHRAWLLGCGFASGVLGGAYGMNGPPLAVYGAMRRWSAQHFRATLQGYFLPASIVGMAGYWFMGFWTAAVTRYYLLSLPVAVVATLIGRMLNKRMSGNGFLQYIYIMLIAIGAILLAEALRGHAG